MPCAAFIPAAVADAEARRSKLRRLRGAKSDADAPSPPMAEEITVGAQAFYNEAAALLAVADEVWSAGGRRVAPARTARAQRDAQANGWSCRAAAHHGRAGAASSR